MATGKALGYVADAVEADVDATWDQDAADLVNELKAQLNSLLSELRERGWMDTTA